MTYLIRPHESDCEWREVEQVTDEMRRDFEVKRKGDEMSDVRIKSGMTFVYGDTRYRFANLELTGNSTIMIKITRIPDPPYHWLGADAEAKQ